MAWVAFSGGMPAPPILRKIESYELVISPAILDELQRVVHYQKIQEKYNLPKENVQQFLHLVQKEAIVVEPAIKIAALKTMIPITDI